MWRNGIVAVLVAFIGLATPVIATADPGEWDPTLPKLISAGAPGDPLAVANASLQASAIAAQTTMDLGRSFLASLGISGPSNPAPLKGNRVYGAQAIEYVIRRAGSQMGVPYSWGGGSLTGPSRGIDSGATLGVQIVHGRHHGGVCDSTFGAQLIADISYRHGRLRTTRPDAVHNDRFELPKSACSHLYLLADV